MKLVRPEELHEKAIFRAASAADVVENAETYDRLEDAIGMALVIGTSLEDGIPWPVVDPKQAAQEVLNVVCETATGGDFVRERI